MGYIVLPPAAHWEARCKPACCNDCNDFCGAEAALQEGTVDNINKKWNSIKTELKSYQQERGHHEKTAELKEPTKLAPKHKKTIRQEHGVEGLNQEEIIEHQTKSKNKSDNIGESIDRSNPATADDVTKKTDELKNRAKAMSKQPPTQRHAPISSKAQTKASALTS